MKEFNIKVIEINGKIKD